jgi:hypothetical protein
MEHCVLGLKTKIGWFGSIQELFEIAILPKVYYHALLYSG